MARVVGLGVQDFIKIQKEQIFYIDKISYMWRSGGDAGIRLWKYCVYTVLKKKEMSSAN